LGLLEPLVGLEGEKTLIIDVKRYNEVFDGRNESEKRCICGGKRNVHIRVH
jgi:hypothetical protein